MPSFEAIAEPAPRASRYELLERIASGGMATVYVGRLRGGDGAPLVAIKRAHAHLIDEPDSKRMLVTEARLASRIRHPNVVAVHDVEELADEVLLVMEYVDGVAFSKLLSEAYRHETPLPPAVAVRIVLDACRGLHAAHTLSDDDGRPLGIVHRDVSPHNILVGTDGVSRIADFGVAKCAQSSTHATRTGVLKGKAGYMAPEYIRSRQLDARSDVFALSIVLWEALANRRLFRGDDELDTLQRIASMEIPRIGSIVADLAPLDDVLLTGMQKVPAQRFASAFDLAEALERAAESADLLAAHLEVACVVQAHAGERLARLRALAGTPKREETDEPTALMTRPITKTIETHTDPLVEEPFTHDASTVTGTVSPQPPQHLAPRPRSRRWWRAAAVIAAAMAIAAIAFLVNRPVAEQPTPAAPAREPEPQRETESQREPEPQRAPEPPAAPLLSSLPPPPTPPPAKERAKPPGKEPAKQKEPPKEPAKEKAPPNPYATP